MTYDDYLVTANKARSAIDSGVDPADALCEALADLERLIRKPPTDQPFIGAGDLRGTPITSAVVQAIENAGHTGADKGVYALSGVVGVGALISGVKALEQQVRGLANRMR